MSKTEDTQTQTLKLTDLKKIRIKDVKNVKFSVRQNRFTENSETYNIKIIFDNLVNAIVETAIKKEIVKIQSFMRSKGDIVTKNDKTLADKSHKKMVDYFANNPTDLNWTFGEKRSNGGTKVTQDEKQILSAIRSGNVDGLTAEQKQKLASILSK